MKHVIYSKEELDSIRPYENNAFLKYPNKYPIIIEFESYDYGLMGYGYVTKIIAVPDDVDSESFIKGVLAKEITYSEKEVFGKKYE